VLDRDTALQEIVRRIVEVAHPQRIVLFGSAARGQMGFHSDFDLLVIKAGPVHRGHLEAEIYRCLGGVGQPVDVIVATCEDIERYGQSAGLVYREALRDGKVLYDETGALLPR